MHLFQEEEEAKEKSHKVLLTEHERFAQWAGHATDDCEVCESRSGEDAVESVAIDGAAFRVALGLKQHRRLADLLHRLLIATRTSAASSAANASKGKSNDNTNDEQGLVMKTMNKTHRDTAQPSLVQSFLSSRDEETAPRILTRDELRAIFFAADADADGRVTPRDLALWCAATGCPGLVSAPELVSLFMPLLPDFRPPKLPTRKSRRRTLKALVSALLETVVACVVSLSSCLSSCLQRRRSYLYLCLNSSRVCPIRPCGAVSSGALNSSKSSEDLRHVVLIEDDLAANTLSGLSLGEQALAASLARRPLLASRFAIAANLVCPLNHEIRFSFSYVLNVVVCFI